MGLIAAERLHSSPTLLAGERLLQAVHGASRIPRARSQIRRLANKSSLLQHREGGIRALEGEKDLSISPLAVV